jgi:hypothetical protein
MISYIILFNREIVVLKINIPGAKKTKSEKDILTGFG